MAGSTSVSAAVASGSSQRSAWIKSTFISSFNEGHRTDEGGMGRRTDRDVSRALPRCCRAADPTEARAATPSADLVRRQRFQGHRARGAHGRRVPWGRLVDHCESSPKPRESSRQELEKQGKDPARFTIGKRIYLMIDDDAGRARTRVARRPAPHLRRRWPRDWTTFRFGHTLADVARGIAEGDRRRRTDDPAQSRSAQPSPRIVSRWKGLLQR